jgi:outer membrane biosynthesis protein TonB
VDAESDIVEACTFVCVKTSRLMNECAVCRSPNQLSATKCWSCGSPLASSEQKAEDLRRAERAAEEQRRTELAEEQRRAELADEQRRAETATDEQHDAERSGDASGGPVSGTIDVGKYVLRLGRPDGAIVDLLPPIVTPLLHALAGPVYRRPPRAYCIGRDAELSELSSHLAARQAVALSGPPGIGKTAMLAEIAHDPDIAAKYADGILYVRAGRRTADDVLQTVFGALFTSDRPVRPANAELLAALTAKNVLVLLDNFEGTPESLDYLARSLPRGNIVAASDVPVAGNRYAALTLAGLSQGAAREVLAHELGRRPQLEEAGSAVSICERLAGNPLRISQIAALAREQQRPLATIAAAIGAERTDQAFQTYLLAPLSEIEKTVLSAVCAFAGAPVDAALIGAITGIPGAETVLRRLRGLRLLAGTGDLYEAPSPGEKAPTAERKRWAAKTIPYLDDWFTRYGADLRSVGERIEPALAAIGIAVNAGELVHRQALIGLCSAVGSACALCAQWGLAFAILEAGIDVAKLAGDRDAEARGNDLKGTLLLLLGDPKRGRIYLMLAYDAWLEIRPEAARASAATYRTVTGEPLVPVAAQPARPEPQGAKVVVEPNDEPISTADFGAQEIRRGAKPLALNPWLIAAGLAVAAAALLWFSFASAKLFVAPDGALCYTVERATRAELEPLHLRAIADGDAHCLRVAPAVATTYQLVAYGRLGNETRSEPVVVPGTAPTSPPPSPPPPASPPPTPPVRTPAPQTAAPRTPVPQSPAPDTAAPQTPAPQTPAPQTPVPQTPVPRTPVPPRVTAPPVAIVPGRRPAIAYFTLAQATSESVCVRYRVENATSIVITNAATRREVYARELSAGESAENPEPCLSIETSRYGRAGLRYVLTATGTGDAQVTRSLELQAPETELQRDIYR